MMNRQIKEAGISYIFAFYKSAAQMIYGRILFVIIFICIIDIIKKSVLLRFRFILGIIFTVCHTYKKRAVFFAYLLGKQFLKKLCSLNFSSLSSSRGSQSATISCGLRLLEKSDSPHCFSVKFQNVVIFIRNRPPHGISSRVNSEIVLSE